MPDAMHAVQRNQQHRRQKKGDEKSADYMQQTDHSRFPAHLTAPPVLPPDAEMDGTPISSNTDNICQAPYFFSSSLLSSGKKKYKTAIVDRIISHTTPNPSQRGIA